MKLLLAFLKANWLHIAIALGLAFVVYRIDQNGYERAERAAAAREAAIAQQVKEMETRISERVNEIDKTLSGRIAEIDTTERTIIVPTLTKEIASDPRFSDTEHGITDEMRKAINAARSLSHDDAE